MKSTLSNISEKVGKTTGKNLSNRASHGRFRLIGAGFLTIGFLAAAVATQAQNDLDFTHVTENSDVTTAYSSLGLTIQTVDADGNVADAYANPAFSTGFGGKLDVYGVVNSLQPDANYPAAENLDFLFSSPTEVYSFVFNNIGAVASGRGDSFWTAYDSSGAVLASANVSRDNEDTLVTLNLADVSMLQFNDGTTVEESLSGDDNNWWFSVASLDFAPVPEPSSVGLTALGGVGLLVLRRKK